MAETVDYTCPICGLPTTLTPSQVDARNHTLSIGNAQGPHVLHTTYRVCPNPRCKRFSLEAILTAAMVRGRDLVAVKEVKRWMLVPPSAAKAFPEYVPSPIRADYEEACLIREGSPKAAATLCRRCLQGMIRDFWSITKSRLKDEIDELQGKIDELTWQAIDAVRKIGNIGAHMEKDVNVIVDVDPDEAEKLIWLIELLIREWYTNREERKERLAEITELAKSKDAERQAPPTPQV